MVPAPIVLYVASGTPVTALTTAAGAVPLAADLALVSLALSLMTTKTPTTSSTATTAARAVNSLARRSRRACAARIAASLAWVSSRRCFLVSRSATGEAYGPMWYSRIAFICCLNGSGFLGTSGRDPTSCSLISTMSSLLRRGRPVCVSHPLTVNQSRAAVHELQCAPYYAARRDYSPATQSI